MFESLGSLRDLEDLFLLRSVDQVIADDSILHNLPMVHLPSLKVLYAEEGPHVCAALSCSLRVPNACLVNMHAICSGELSDTVTRNLFTHLSWADPPHGVYIKPTSTGLIVRSTLLGPFIRGVNISGLHWRANTGLLAEIGAQLSARATIIYLGVRIPVKDDEIGDLTILCGGAAAVATGFRFEGAPVDLAIAAACMADRTGFLPGLRMVWFLNFDMGAATDMDVDMWVQALMERRKAGVVLHVDWEGCTGVSMELRKRLRWAR